MDRQLFNRTQAAEYLGLTRATLLRWQKINYGPFAKRTPGGLLYYSRASLNAFLAEFDAENSSKSIGKTSTQGEAA